MIVGGKKRGLVTFTDHTNHHHVKDADGFIDILVATLANKFKQRAHRNGSTFGLKI